MKIITEPDIQKAKSLNEMAKITFDRLNEIDKEKYPSNTLVDYYEIIRKLLEALSALEGIKIKGEAAHFELINHICKTYKFADSDKTYIQELRNYRNRVAYEGFSVNKNFISTNSKRIEEMIISLKTKVEEKITILEKQTKKEKQQ